MTFNLQVMAEPNEHWGLTMSKTRNFWGHRTPMTPVKTLIVSFPIYIPEKERDYYLDLEQELNNDVGIRAFIFYFNGPGWCVPHDGWNEVCFGWKERTPGDWSPEARSWCDEVKCPPIKKNHNGMFAGWDGTREKGFDQFDIAISWPYEFTPRNTLKHELLHALGFAHVPNGVMSKYSSFTGQINRVQLKNWQKAIKKRRFDEIIPNCYNRPDLPDCC